MILINSDLEKVLLVQSFKVLQCTELMLRSIRCLEVNYSRVYRTKFLLISSGLTIFL